MCINGTSSMIGKSVSPRAPGRTRIRFPGSHQERRYQLSGIQGPNKQISRHSLVSGSTGSGGAKSVQLVTPFALAYHQRHLEIPVSCEEAEV